MRLARLKNEIINSRHQVCVTDANYNEVLIKDQNDYGRSVK